jgi:hypothetical protein
MEYGYPLPKRIDMIENHHKSSATETLRFKFRGSMDSFKISKVSLAMPKYRLNNGRTQAAQEEYLVNHADCSIDFFSRDLESVSAQEAQHQILKEMLPKAGLLSGLKKEKQEVPLILSAEGFVVNGNRRLCAMRELNETAPEQYSHFSHADIVVLPPCEEKDIDELEADLQIKKDTKAEYTWITLAIMLKKRRDSYSYSDKELAKRYDLSIKEVKLYLSMLNEVDKYLAQRGNPKRYHLVESAKHAFEEIVVGRSKLADEGKKDIFEKISYCLLENTSKAGGRLYKAIPDVKDYLEPVTELLKEELPLENYKEDDNTDDLNELFGEIDHEHIGLSKAIDDPQNKNVVLDAVQQVVEDEKVKEKHKLDAGTVLKFLTRANTSLNSAVNILNDKTNKKGIVEQLETIIGHAETIRLWLTKNDA